jgi:PAS domain S-box-containing protein
MRNVRNTSQGEKIIPTERTNPDYIQYKIILETSMDGFWMTDINGNIMEVNNAYCNLTGYRRSELLSMNVADVEVLESPAEVKKHIKMLNRTGSHRFITKHKCKNGKIIELEVSANSIKSDHIKTFAFFRDITDHIKAEKEIIKARRDWENIFQAIGQPSFILNPEQSIIAANKATVTMTGIPAEQLIGKKCYEVFHKKNSPPEECPLQKVFNSGCIETAEMEIELFGGIYLVSCTPVFNNQGVLEKVIQIATDITERKQTEQQIYEYQKQLKQMDSEILLAEEQERHRIAAGIHDDIGQRLAIIKFGLDSLQASELHDDVLSSLKRQSELISGAIEELRTFTFELSNPILYEIGVEAAIEAWMIDHIQNKCGIKCNFTTKGPKIDLTEEVRIILFQGVRELLTNIVKHAKADYAEVNIIRSDKNIQIFVEDNGIGLNASEALKRKKVKKGFGLFNLRERLDYLGGTLEIQNLSPKGTVAIIHVPLKQEAKTTGWLLS